MRNLIGLTAFGVLAVASGIAHGAGIKGQGQTVQVARASGGGSAGRSSALPQSTVIQQRPTRQYYSGPTAGPVSIGGTTNAPTTASPLNTFNPPVEPNRIDTAGPPRESIQIDDGVAGAIGGTSTTTASPTTSSPGAVGSPGTAGSSSGGTAGSSSTGASTGASGSSGGGGN